MREMSIKDNFLSYLSILLWHHVQVRLLISTDWRLRNLVVAVILKLHFLYLIGNLMKQLFTEMFKGNKQTNKQ